VGYGRFFELTVSNRELGAEEALRMGIVDYVVPQEKFDEELTGIASEIARGPTRTIGLLKRAINRNVLPELISAMEYEAELQDEAAATEDHREAALAFFEKRKPVFKGS
jgi:2-(1,2-epoxy-1,2-dihydrophenyl)acetyl-CoA isomerase